MQVILFSTAFKKRYRKYLPNQRAHFKERLNLFETEPFHPLLNNHALHTPYDGCRSINMTGDIRAIYEPTRPDLAYFIKIGTHPELYG